MRYLQFYSRGTRERTIAFTSIQNRTLLSGAHPGSELKVNFHHMANDTLPLVFHTERHGRLICTREETDAVRVRVLRVVTPKTSRQRRTLSKTRGRERALSESSLGARGWGKTCREAECQKFHTHLETQAPVCGSLQSKTQVTVEQDCLRIMDRAVEQEWVKIC